MRNYSISLWTKVLFISSTSYYTNLKCICTDLCVSCCASLFWNNYCVTVCVQIKNDNFLMILCIFEEILCNSARIIKNVIFLKTLSQLVLGPYVYTRAETLQISKWLQNELGKNLTAKTNSANRSTTRSNMQKPPICPEMEKVELVPGQCRITL